MTDAQVLDAETARGQGCEGMADGVEPRHSAQDEEQGLDDRETQVNEPEDLGGSGYPGGYLVHGRTGSLRFHETEAAEPEEGKDRDGEDDDAHAAEPVSRGAPEKQGAGQYFYIREYARSRGRESAHHLIERVYEGGYIARQEEGEGSDKGSHQPCEGDEKKTFPIGEIRSPILSAHETHESQEEKSGKGGYEEG